MLPFVFLKMFVVNTLNEITYLLLDILFLFTICLEAKGKRRSFTNIPIRNIETKKNFNLIIESKIQANIEKIELKEFGQRFVK